MDQQVSRDKRLWDAGAAVAESLEQFEAAVERLVGRLEVTGEHLHHLRQVKERAENLVHQMLGFSQRTIKDVKENPLGYVAVAGLIGLFLFSRRPLRARLNQP